MAKPKLSSKNLKSSKKHLGIILLLSRDDKYIKFIIWVFRKGLYRRASI